ncbi:MAG: response regulator, partial [Symploca sp. SIO2D2]|nr:response regulator [Symploca sp. SIO2D2]
SQKMGGDLSVESESGKGSVFRFQFEAHHSESRLQEPTRDVPTLKDKYALVIDENAQSRNELHINLSAWGAKTELAGNWEEAAPLLTSFGRFDLVCVSESIANKAGNRFEDAIYVAGIDRVAMRTDASTSNEEHRTWALTYSLPVEGSRLKEICESLTSNYEASRSCFKRQELAQNRPLKILLAEDNQLSQKMLTLMGQSLGYEITIAESGEEAVKAVSNGNFDLVLMDIQMPDMDGIEATKIIRSSNTLSIQPYIVAVTSGAMEEDRKASQEAGMNAFAVKPLTRETMIKHFIDAHQALHGHN